MTLGEERVVVVGASAGGVQALSTFVGALPGDLAVPVCIVLHQPPDLPSVLPRLLDRAGPLPASHAEHDQALTAGHLHVAAPSRHLLVEPGRLVTGTGPRENGHRPAIDVLLRSAARAYGPGAIAVVLSGSLDDGSAGVVAVAAAGGEVLVQDPDDALYPEMPSNALRALEHRAPTRSAADLAVAVADLAGSPVGGGHTTTRGGADTGAEGEHSPTDRDDPAGAHAPTDPGPPASSDDAHDATHAEVAFDDVLSCPSCGGPVLEHEQDRFHCRIGHRWSLESYAAEQAGAVESSMWAAIRTLEERSAVCRRLEQRARRTEQDRAVARFARQAADAGEHAASLRTLLDDDVALHAPGPSPFPPPTAPTTEPITEPTG